MSKEQTFKPRTSLPRSPPPSVGPVGSAGSVASGQASKGLRREEDDDQQLEYVGELEKVRSVRKALESFLFNDSNKIANTAKKTILEMFGKVEGIVQDLDGRYMMLQGRLHERDDLDRVVMRVREEAPSGLPSPRGRAAAPATYASTLAKPRQVVIVKPKDGEQVKDSQEVKNKVKKTIDKDVDKIRFKSIRMIRDKRIVVETEGNKDMEVFKRKIEQEGVFDLQMPGIIRPRLVIFDVDRDMSDREFMDVLVSKNLEFLESDLKNNIRIVYKTGPRNRDTVNYVVEVPGRVRDVLLVQGRIFLKWGTHKVLDRIEITRCYRCQGFGHVAKRCDGAVMCGHCGEKGHKFEECQRKNEASKCVNCMSRGRDAGHSVNSRECPEYIRAAEALKARTDFS